MKKTVKILIALLTFTLVIGVLFAVSAGATEESKTPKIISQNVYYDDVFSLMYAVSADSVNEGPVTLNVYYEYPDQDSEIKHTYTANSAEIIQINGVDTSAFVFVTNGVAAKSLTDNFFVQAVDAAGAKSEVKRYSVIEYMYQRLSGQQQITESQKQLYTTVIEFASWSTQVLVNEKDKDASNDVALAIDYSYVFFPAGDGLIGESATATYGYPAGIWAKDSVVYPYIPGATNVTVAVYDDNFQPTSVTVIPNATPLTLSGDTTVITAGGEITEPAYKPDLSDTENRLCFDDDKLEQSYARLSLNTCGFDSGIVDGAPYGTASKVYKLIAKSGSSGNEEINYFFGKGVSAPSNATSFSVEVDLMFENTSSSNASFYTQLRGGSVAKEYRFRATAGGEVELVGLGDNITVAECGEWFRYRVEYVNDNGTYSVNHYVNDVLVANSAPGSNLEVTALDRLRLYADSGANATLYSDNVKVWYE